MSSQGCSRTEKIITAVRIRALIRQADITLFTGLMLRGHDFRYRIAHGKNRATLATQPHHASNNLF